MPVSPFTQRVLDLIRSIPRGRVSTYGRIARMAGNPRAARQVARILHSCSDKEDLPWHRVVNRHGRISLKPMQGYERQKERLVAEGVAFNARDRIDPAHFAWSGE